MAIDFGGGGYAMITGVPGATGAPWYGQSAYADKHTVSCWLYLRSLPAVIMKLWGSTYEDAGYSGRIKISVLANGSIEYVCAMGGSNTTYTSAAGLVTTGEWHHVMIAYSYPSPNGLVWSVDGQETTTTSVGYNKTYSTAVTHTLYVGKNGTSSGGFDGIMADFSIGFLQASAEGRRGLSMGPKGAILDLFEVTPTCCLPFDDDRYGMPLTARDCVTGVQLDNKGGLWTPTPGFIRARVLPYDNTPVVNHSRLTDLRRQVRAASGSVLSQSLGELLALADGRLSEAGALRAETLGLSDARTAQASHSLGELLALADAVGAAAGFARQMAETLGLGDARTAGGGALRTQGLGLTDAVQATLGALLTQGLSEVLALDDAAMRAAGRVLAEALGLSDTRAAGARAALSELLSLADARTADAARALGEALGLADSALAGLVGMGLILVRSAACGDSVGRSGGVLGSAARSAGLLNEPGRGGGRG